MLISIVLMSTTVFVSRVDALDPEDDAPEVERDPGAAQPDPPPPDEPEPETEVDLLPRVTLAETVGWILHPEPEPSDPETVAERRLDRMLAAHVMRDSLEHIGADGWYHHVAQEMRQALQVDMNEVIRDGRRGMNVLQRAVSELGRYANGPSAPQGGPATPTPELRNPADPAQQYNDTVMDHMNLRNGAVNWYRVEVRLTQAPDGDLLASWIIRSSGNRVVDRAVMQAVRDGTTRVPPPPPEIVGERRAIVSEWAIEVGDVATTLGQAGCVFGGGDEMRCTNGLGRGIWRSRIRLLRVLDERHPSFEETQRSRRLQRERRANRQR